MSFIEMDFANGGGGMSFDEFCSIMNNLSTTNITAIDSSPTYGSRVTNLVVGKTYAFFGSLFDTSYNIGSSPFTSCTGASNVVMKAKIANSSWSGIAYFSLGTFKATATTADFYTQYLGVKRNLVGAVVQLD